MGKIELKYAITVDNEKELSAWYTTIKSIEGKTLVWNIMDHEFHFLINIIPSIVENRQSDGFHIRKIREYLENHPDDTEVKERLSQEEAENSKVRKTYQLFIILRCEANVEISLEENIVRFPDKPVPSWEEVVQKDLCIGLCFDLFDDCFLEKVIQYGRAFYFTLLFVFNDLYHRLSIGFSIMVDDVFVKHIKVNNSLCLNDLADSDYTKILTTHVSFDEAWNWIEKNTSLCGTKERSPIYISSLLFAMNREPYETILYLIIALESIYTKGNKNISYQLRKHICSVIPNVNENEIKKIYDKRSSFAHGDVEISILDSYLEFENDPDSDSAIWLLLAVLLETIRQLIKHDSIGINFTETISHDFQSR